MWLIGPSPVGGNLPFELKAGEFDIGRSKECDVVILDSSVSPIHARLRVSPAGDLHLADLGSNNGTFVNDRRITATRLDPKDGVRLGAISLRLAADALNQVLAEAKVNNSRRLSAKAHLCKRKRLKIDLTRAEKEVLQLIAKGLSEEEIAELLERSYHTIHSHLKVIFKFFGVHSKLKLIARYAATLIK